MSSFTTPADLRIISPTQMMLLSPFAYHVGAYPSQDIITVPAGTVTDLATTPRWLWSVLPPFGHYAKAAIVHDYLYQQAVGSKRYADGVFLEAMTVLGVPRWRRVVMYWAVRVCGKGNYR